MKIFISWSGERSRMIAEALKVWLPDVLNFLEPWISSEDIDKGARWGSDLEQQLANTHIGLVCVTPENINAPWILFESGALSKALDRSRVCPYLFELRRSDLTGPLVQFQATEAAKEDTARLLATLNRAIGPGARSDEQLRRSFEKWWPELEKSLVNIPKSAAPTQKIRSEREIVEEILDLVRLQAKSRLELPVTDLVRGQDIEDFARRTNVEAEDDDPNSSGWTDWVAADIKSSPLEGVWASRWNGGSAGGNWQSGLATLIVRGRFLVIVYSSMDSVYYPYLIVARRSSNKIYSGRYVNLSVPNDTSPWIGRIVSDSRIDGYWSEGRWDFRR